MYELNKTQKDSFFKNRFFSRIFYLCNGATQTPVLGWVGLFYYLFILLIWYVLFIPNHTPSDQWFLIIKFIDFSRVSLTKFGKTFWLFLEIVCPIIDLEGALYCIGVILLKKSLVCQCFQLRCLKYLIK